MEIRKRPAEKGFHLLKHRWIVERTFGWLGRYRLLAKDYAATIASGEAEIHLAMTHLMLNRLTHQVPENGYKVADDIFKPNGLCFSPDYKKLYAADTGSSHYEEATKNIRVWDIVEETTLKNGRQFASMELELNGKVVAGQADGIRADEDGNIWSSAGWVGSGYDGCHIFAAEDGARIGQIRLPEICSNVCFGGTKRNGLFMTGSQSLYAVYTETKGAHIT